MRTTLFFPHPALDDLVYSAFSVIKEIAIITGGMSYEEGETQINYRRTYLIKLPTKKLY
jgi:hypothetical protein